MPPLTSHTPPASSPELPRAPASTGLEEQEQEEELRVEGLEPPPPPPVAGVRRIHSSPAIASTSSIAAAGVTITAEAAGTTVGCREEWRGKLGVDAVESEGGEGWRRRRRPRGDANEGSWG